MSDSYLDHIPSHEQKKLRNMMSASAYEKLREKVKGPEDLKEEMKHAEKLAEVHFSLESEPHLQDAAKHAVEAMMEQGIENVIEDMSALSEQAKDALLKGKFTVAVRPHPSDHHDVMMIVPEGNVQEGIPLKASLSATISSSVVQKKF